MSLVVGTGVFVLSLMLFVVFLDAGVALLVAAGAGLAAGAAGYGAGLMMGLSEAPPAPPLPPAPPEPPKPEMEETKKIEPSDLGPGPDLERTVRLDKEGLDYVLPGLSPEDLFSGKEQNLEDTATLAALAGIEGGPAVEENKEEEPPPATEGGPI